MFAIVSYLLALEPVSPCEKAGLQQWWSRMAVSVAIVCVEQHVGLRRRRRVK